MFFMLKFLNQIVNLKDTKLHRNDRVGSRLDWIEFKQSLSYLLSVFFVSNLTVMEIFDEVFWVVILVVKTATICQNMSFA